MSDERQHFFGLWPPITASSIKITIKLVKIKLVIVKLDIKLDRHKVRHKVRQT